MTEPEIKLELEIENFYEEIEPITTNVTTTVPYPPDGDWEDTDWSYDYIFEHTGTGHTTGSSGYFVQVLNSSDPTAIPPGTTWEFI